MSHQELSGSAARKWRNGIAKHAVKPSGYTRTLSFPLDMGGEQPFEFSAAERLYNVTDGVGKGSLMGLLSAIHASGFRLFPQVSGAQLFKNDLVMDDDEFARCLLEGGIDHSFGASCLFLALKVLPRKENAIFDAEHVSMHFHRQTQVNADMDKDGEYQSLMRGIGDALVSSFPSWKEARKDLSSPLSVIDGVLSGLGYKTPSLVEKNSRMVDISPKGSVLVFDVTRPRFLIDPASGVEWHIVVGSYLHEAVARGEKKPLDAVHVAIETTKTTYTGMSWLFGVGLNYLRSTSAASVMRDMDIPTKFLPYIEQVVDYARAIPADGLFGISYADYRPLVGGKIASWITNYTKRLNDLSGLVCAVSDEPFFPDGLLDPKAEYFFRGMSVDRDGLESLHTMVATLKPRVADALSRLSGVTDGVSRSDIDEVDRFSALIDRLSVNLNQVQNAIEQVVELGCDDELVGLAKSCQFKAPAWIKSLPVMNRLTGGVPDYLGEIKGGVLAFENTFNEMKEHFDRIRLWSQKNGHDLDPLWKLTEREAAHLSSIKSKGPGHDLNPRRRATRIILSNFAKQARRCSVVTRSEVMSIYQGVFANNRDANLFFINQKGSIFISLFSRGNHYAYNLAEGVELRDWPAILKDFLDQMRLRVFSPGVTKERMEDYLRLSRAWYSIMLTGIPDIVPSSLARSALLDEKLPLELSVLLEADVVTGDVLRKAFNHYHNILNGLNVLLMRRDFFVRTRFQQVGNCRLMYATKDREWAIPSHYFKSESLLRIPMDQLGLSDGVPVIPAEAIGGLCAQKVIGERPSRELLRQMPHDWCFDLGVQGDAHKTSGLMVKFKESMEVSTKMVSASAYRLIGVSAHKSEIDRALVEAGAENGIKIGDIMIVVDNRFEQHIDLDASGKMSVRIVDAGYQVKVGLPVTDNTIPSESHPFFDRYIAIDQGEVGFGWALFDAKTHGLLKSGYVNIPSIRRLIHAADGFRKVHQPRQKFQSRINTGLFSIRENVVGDICHAIDNLMYEHRAFPVFESTVGNLEQGSKQLSMVYKSLLANYIYTGIDAHTAVRESHWCGSDRWEHPYLQTYETEVAQEDANIPMGKKRVKTGKVKPLSIFPGGAVHPYGTSQTCSCCGRNAIRELQDMMKAGEKKIVVSNGVVAIPSGTIKPVRQPKKDEMSDGDRSELLKNNLRAEHSIVSLKDGEIDIKNVISAVRQSLRRPPRSLRSKDTTQSRYVCVMNDCGKESHADVNAAINIGQKFRKEKLAPGLAI